MLKLMKNLASYALWKWKGWFVETEHNSSVCVIEFTLFLHFSFLLKFKKKIFLFLCIQWYKKCWNRWKFEQVMPFKNEEGDLQKLNIIIKFVFLSLNSLYIAPLPLTFQQNL
jgi:hypothetical protein